MLAPDVIDDDTDDDSRPLQELRRLIGGTCVACHQPYTPWEALSSIAMGFKTAPRCLTCLARGFHRDVAGFNAELQAYMQRRACYRRAWESIEQLMTPTHSDSQPAETATMTPNDPVPTIDWDAGDLGCGDLVLALRLRLKALPSGASLTLRATDAAAPEDLPAWCSLTGNVLVSAQHPIYTIRRF